MPSRQTRAGAQSDSKTLTPPPEAAPGLTDWERDRIRRRAHALWCEAGFPDGRDREFWARAELQVLKGTV